MAYEILAVCYHLNDVKALEEAVGRQCHNSYVFGQGYDVQFLFDTLKEASEFYGVISRQKVVRLKGLSDIVETGE